MVASNGEHGHDVACRCERVCQGRATLEREVRGELTIDERDQPGPARRCGPVQRGQPLERVSVGVACRPDLQMVQLDLIWP